MKKSLKIMTQVISVILSAVLAAEALPMQAFAESNNTDVSSETAETVENLAYEEEAEAVVLAEDTEKREENVKHFRMSDGTIKAAQYEEPVHFLQNGKWVDYDNTLTEVDADDAENEGRFLFKNKDLINQTADYSVRLSKKTNGKKFVRIEKDGYKLSWYYVGANKSTAKVAEKSDDGDPTTLEKLNSTVLYKNVFKSTDLEYIIGSTGLKENLILDSKKAPKEFTAEYKANGLTPVQVDGKTIELRAENGTVIYTVTAPFMADADGAYSDGVALTLDSVKNNTFSVKITLDGTWLDAQDRVYPVTVDPLLMSSQKWTDDTVCHSAYIASATPNAKYGRGGANYEGSIYVGNTNGRGKTRGLIKNPTLPTLGAGDKVVHAEMAMYVNACYPELIINLHRITSSWDQKTVCWNSNVQYDSAIVDYQTVQYMETNTQNATRWQCFEITELVKGWYDGTYQNNGVLLRSDKENSTSQARAWMFSSGYTSASAARPILAVSYRNMSGYEDYYSYTSVGAGRGGAASVNNYNGNLVFSQPLTEDAGGNLMPVNISLVFNTNGVNAPYSYMAFNMKTNYHIYLRYDSVTAANGYKYSLTDADGTKHWFKFEDNSPNSGKDEDGLGLTLDVINVGSDTNENKARFRITDKDKNKMYFDNSGNLIRIMNLNGVSSVVEYETYENTLRIKNIKDGAGRAYKFIYHTLYPHLVVAVEDPAGRQTEIQYYLGYLSYLTFPDGRGFGFTYDRTNATLTEIRSIDGTKTNITYDGTQQKRVTNIKWGTGDSTLESYTFAYKQNSTKITDIQNRSYTYQFNDWGQTTGVVSDTDGSAQFFKLHEGNSTDSRANKLIQESRVLKTVTNYAINPGFTRSYEGYSNYIQDTANQSVSVDSSQKNLTNNALKIYKAASNTGRVNSVQYLNGLAGGTYTFSAHINTNGATLTGEAWILAEVWTTGGQHVSSNWAEHTVKTDGWERKSVTFNVPSGCQVRLVLGFSAGGSGTVWYDDLQLEKGEGTSTFNLVENSDFTNGLTQWTSENGVQGTLTSAGLTGFEHSIKIPGTVEDTYRGALQQINVSGKKGDVFSFGMWAYASSAPINNGTKDDDSYRPCFKVILHYYDTSGKWAGDAQVDCNADLKQDWQFLTQEAIIPIDYSRIAIALKYDHNVNNAYITGAFCYKEQYGQTYTYDKDGNVTSTVDLAKTNSQFKYADQQLSKVLNPSGSEFMYRYDANTNNMTLAQSTDGIRYKYAYDSKGNPTSAMAEQMPIAVQLDTSTTYIIRNKYSTNALDSGGGNSTVQNWRCGDVNAFQKWTLESAGESGVYYLKSNGKYMYVEGNSSADYAKFKMSATKGSGNEFKFKIQYNDNGTYRILTKSSNYAKCVDGMPGSADDLSDGTPISQYTYGGTDSGQHWFFFKDPTGRNTEYLTASTTYTSSKNFVSSSTDQRGNSTTYFYNETKGLLNSVTDANGNTTSYTYDPNNNALLSVSSGGMTNSYTYENDRLKTINVNGSLQYAFEYDAFGRRTNTKVGSGTNLRTLSSLAYNSSGLLSKQTYGNGNYINFSYDNLDRVTEKKYNGDSNKRVTYSYGADGKTSRITDYFTNTNTRFVYDLAGRVVSQREFAGTGINSNQMKSYTDFTYADKTNYLTGIKHYSPIGTQNITYTYGNLASGEMPDQIYGVKWNGQEKVKYTYDGLGRLTNKTVGGLNNTYTYENVNATRTTTLVKSVQTAAGTYTYTYDNVGNILSIHDGTYTTSYEYDSLNQLVRENDQRAGATYTYSYVNGNITEKKEYAYTTGELGAVQNTSHWTYGDSTWTDLVTEFDGTVMTYDTIGNMITIDDYELTWSGRQLQSVSDGMHTYSYQYNADGQRISKDFDGTTTEFFYNGSILAGQKTGDDVIVFMYDNNGDIFGFIYNGTEYYYIKNAQNDVVALADSSGTIIANYYYDAWGRVLDIVSSQTIAYINPILYRSYYYDYENGFYYLNSRYYSPDICRFLNGDSLAQTGQGLLDKNMFAYCGNNPINFFDPTGHNLIGIIVCVVGSLFIGWLISESANKTKEPTKITIKDVAEATASEISSTAKVGIGAFKIKGGYDNAIDHLQQHSKNMIDASNAKRKKQPFSAKNVDKTVFSSDEQYTEYCLKSVEKFDDFMIASEINIRNKRWDDLSKEDQLYIESTMIVWDIGAFYDLAKNNATLGGLSTVG